MATLQIMTAETTTANSSSFRINLGALNAKNGDKAYIGIYGTLGTASFDLQWKNPSGTYTSTGDRINGLGLFELPFSSEVILRLAVTAGGGSSISACVFNGIAE